MDTIAGRLVSLAGTAPERAALSNDHVTLTFGELADQGLRISKALAARGVHPGARVAFAGRDGIGQVAELLGIWLAGAVAVPMDFRTPAAETARLMEEFEIGFLLHDRLSAETSRTVILRGEEWSREVARSPASGPHRLALGQDAMISLTSGTTGRPAGVVVSHGEMLARAIRRKRVSGDGSIFAHCGMMSFSAVRNHVFAHLHHGSLVHFLPPLMGAGEFIERLGRLGATNAFVVPTMVHGMLKETEGRTTPVLPDLRCLWHGGAGISLEQKVESYRRITHGFLHCFSSSLTGNCSILSGDDLLARPESDGRILPEVTVEIVDDDDRPLPHGEIGHLRVRSPETATRILGERRGHGDQMRGGWAYTGDLARRDDAFLTIVGRSVDSLLRGGVNVYPSEIEAKLSALDGVVECAVVGYPDERVGEEIAAFIAVRGDLTVKTIVAHCREVLPPDKRPRRVILVDALPRNPNGKILRRELVVPGEGTWETKPETSR